MPDSFTNLTVLPSDTPKDELMDVMKSFSTALGVRCIHCHVQKTPGDYDSVDWASDDLEPKKVARGMMKLVQSVNGDLLPDAGVKGHTVSCVTCHSARGPRPLPKQASELKEFHVGMKFQHGKLECGSCHDDSAPHRLLHLASGEKVEMPQAMRLCAQCHGPQKRDYDHGAHGGMNGYWDRSRGERVRNNCVDCHDPLAREGSG